MTKPNVIITDVGPRDGLQNEKQFVPTELKRELITRLIDAGVANIEAASFVSPKWVPQMADGAALLAQVPRTSGVFYSALTPNMQGFEAASQAGVGGVVIFAASSEAFSQKNINCSITESINRFKPVVQTALAQGLKVRAAISCVFGCPYEGEVPAEKTLSVLAQLNDLGVESFSLADTIGTGTPDKVLEVFAAAAKRVEIDRLVGHFHNTYGAAIANVAAALSLGVRRFESSVGGLGGCPYAKGATGNVATEDVIHLLHRMGYDTGIDLIKLAQTGRWISQALGREYNALAGKASLAKLESA